MEENRISVLMKDPCYKKWYESMHIAKSTLWSYSYGLEMYCQFSGMTLSQLVEEARTDYKNKVEPWESKHVNRFKDFVTYLKSMNGELSNNTKLNYAKGIKNFYSFHIGVPFNIKIGIQQGAREEYLDLPILKLEDVRKAVLDCGTDKMLKAMILTVFSSGQGQAEVRKLQGKHLKEIVNGVAVVRMTRGKTNRRYFFFIGQEALAAIKEYKPNLKDEDFVFTQRGSDKPLTAQEVDKWFAIHAEKCGFDRAYFAPHRGRHRFKTVLEGKMTHTYIEYLEGHKLPGAESNYFLGDLPKMLEEYVKCQHLLTIFTPNEILQRQYDELKRKHEKQLSVETGSMRNEIEQIKQENSVEISRLQSTIDDLSLQNKAIKVAFENEKLKDSSGKELVNKVHDLELALDYYKNEFENAKAGLQEHYKMKEQDVTFRAILFTKMSKKLMPNLTDDEIDKMMQKAAEELKKEIDSKPPSPTVDMTK